VAFSTCTTQHSVETYVVVLGEITFSLAHFSHHQAPQMKDNFCASIVAAVIDAGQPRDLGSFNDLDNFEQWLHENGYTRLGGCEWLRDDDFGFDVSTTCVNSEGVQKIVCYRKVTA